MTLTAVSTSMVSLSDSKGHDQQKLPTCKKELDSMKSMNQCQKLLDCVAKVIPKSFFRPPSTKATQNFQIATQELLQVSMVGNHDQFLDCPVGTGDLGP